MTTEDEVHIDEAERREAERREAERELLTAMQDEMRRIPVADYLVGLLVSLSSMAFQRLGLTAETAGDRDPAQSRLAVDAFAALVEVLAGERPADEITLYRSTLHQMRLAYVAAGESAGAGGGEQTPGSAAAGSGPATGTVPAAESEAASENAAVGDSSPPARGEPGDGANGDDEEGDQG